MSPIVLSLVSLQSTSNSTSFAAAFACRLTEIVSYIVHQISLRALRQRSRLEHSCGSGAVCSTRLPPAVQKSRMRAAALAVLVPLSRRPRRRRSAGSTRSSPGAPRGPACARARHFPPAALRPRSRRAVKLERAPTLWALGRCATGTCGLVKAAGNFSYCAEARKRLGGYGGLSAAALRVRRQSQTEEQGGADAHQAAAFGGTPCEPSHSCCFAGALAAAGFNTVMVQAPEPPRAPRLELREPRAPQRKSPVS